MSQAEAGAHALAANEQKTGIFTAANNDLGVVLEEVDLWMSKQEGG